VDQFGHHWAADDEEQHEVPSFQLAFVGAFRFRSEPPMSA